MVTDRGSQLACLLGGRACRDRVTRHDRIDRLKGKDLGQPPPVVYRSCQVDRLGEIRRGRIGASYRYRDQAAGRERPGQQRRFIDLARDHQSLLGLLHTGGGVDEDVEQGLVGQCPGAHRGRHLEMTRILVGKNAVKPGAPLLDAPRVIHTRNREDASAKAPSVSEFSRFHTKAARRLSISVSAWSRQCE